MNVSVACANFEAKLWIIPTPATYGNYCFICASMNLRVISAFLLIGVFYSTNAQETFPVNGPRNSVHNSYAFTHANIVISSGEVLKDADLLIKDGRITFVGQLSEIPKNAVLRDLNGKWIYPSFIDMDGEYGLKPAKQSKDAASRRSGKAQMNSNTKGAYHWNEGIKPEYNSAENFHVEIKSAQKYRSMGFGAVLTHRHDGLMRGTSAVVFTGDETDNLSLIKARAANHLSFDKGSSKQSYPSSLMGSIALLRQTYYDALWYEKSQEKVEINLSLESLIENKELPSVFEVEDYNSAMRADRIGEEFNTSFIIRGNGDEFQRVDEIKASGASFIIPLKFPLPYEIDNSYDLADIPYSKLKYWEMAPYNALILNKAEVPFAFTADKLTKKDFWLNIRKLEKMGLGRENILSSLTEVPAGMLGLSNELGNLKEGYLANFFIMSDDLFEKEAVMTEHWVNGKLYPFQDHLIDIRGTYNLNFKDDGSYLLTVEGDLMKPKGKIGSGKKANPVNVSLDAHEIALRFTDNEGTVLLSGQVNDDESRIWVGKAQMPDGSWSDWSAIRQEGLSQTPDSNLEMEIDSLIPVMKFPMTAFGWDSLPQEQAILFKYATIWTNEDNGILENADVCIYEGKIKAVGQGLTKAAIFGHDDVPIWQVNAKGKHITCGIIDEHSHIAISKGVNEGGQASSAEVRIGDVINPDDINIYRQLAGGVTASQLLHGSANPIGGQSALIKLRWGMGAEDMKIEGADGFIKFALGENVKQSNWGDAHKERYPQTRMGVEQVYYDHFNRAREYGEVQKITMAGLKKNSKKKNAVLMPRKDLEMDALLEILDSNRFITCHSYVQSEINMLMHVADSMGFRVNTFTHILEGYKVADKMKSHGAGASTFSDWWAYKYEVNDAIPYNAALLSSQGIITAINSDDAEMGRRLNQEAAKAHKYGGLSQEEAWKLVTLNPAILLHLDNRMGSVKAGKDADLVVWSDNPLSVRAKVEKTYIDGRPYFDAERDLEMREMLATDRSRILQKMASKTGTSDKVKFNPEKVKEYHCDDMEDEWNEDQ